MSIDPLTTATAKSYEQKSAANHAVQDVFAEVLAQAGRQGYLSARPLDSDQPLNETITETWDQWFQLQGATRFDVVESPQQLSQDYGQLLLEAHQSGGYAAPQAFLQSLSDEQLSTLQHVNRLVEPIQVDGLTEEGALNLLLPPPTQVDLNYDGLTQSGVGYGIRFPDSRTPAHVVSAWEETTADLDPQERMFRGLQMKLDVLLANIHVDENGRFLRRVEPGDSDFVNPMASPDYSYLEQTQARLESIEYFKFQTPRDQYERDKAFWTRFEQALLDHEAE